MANVGPPCWYCLDDSPSGAPGTGTVGWSAVTPWSAGLGTPAAGTIIRQQNSAPAVGAERCYVCIVSGAVGGGPTFTTTKGVKVTDGSATWMECTGQPGLNGDHGAACTAATNGATAAGSTVLTFSTVPTNVAVGQLVIDETTITGVIPAGATVVSFTSTTVTLSAVVAGAGVGSGDTIAFTNCPTWLMNKNTAVTIGMVIQNGAGTILMICTTAGTTSNSTEPSWSTTAGTINSDGATVKWTTVGLTSNAAYGPWKAPFARMQSAVAASWMTTGHSLFVADNHSETQASAMTIAFPGTLVSPNFIYCITHAASMPPISANLGTAGLITTTGSAVGMTLSGSFSINGLQFSCGTTSTSNMSIGTAGMVSRFDNCVLALPSSTGCGLVLGSTSCKVIMNACTVSAGAAATFVTAKCHIFWTGVTIAGTALTTLWGDNGTSGVVIMKGCDLSLISNILVAVMASSGYADFFLVDCRLNSAVTIATTPAFPGGTGTDMARCDSAVTNYTFGRWRYEGTQTADIVVVRTGGASNGTTALSSKTVTTANAKWFTPFECQPIAIWNTEITQNAVVTLYGVWSATSLPLSDQIWVEGEYLGNGSYPLCSVATDTKASNLASGVALSADTSAWDSLVTTRVNGETVAVGAIRKVADNVGRIFICTAIGTGVLAGSEPGGMASGSAVDGSVVTDGGATWRAGVRFVLTVMLSTPQPQLVGYLRAVVKVAVPSSTVWIDPLITLS